MENRQAVAALYRTGAARLVDPGHEGRFRHQLLDMTLILMKTNCHLQNRNVVAQRVASFRRRRLRLLPHCFLGKA
jgi:hypothetical protein